MSVPLRQDSRAAPPQLPSGELTLHPPPAIEPADGGGGVLMTALPMLGSLGSIAFVASTGSTRGFLAGGMFLVATLGFVGVSIWRQRAQRGAKVTGSRREYLRYLAQTRESVREAADQQRRATQWAHPDPAALPALVTEGSRVWERARENDSFLQVRVGLAPQPLALRLEPPETAPIDQLDPVAASALHRLLVTHRTQQDLPTALDLSAFARVELTGAATTTRALARALVCSAAAFHSPEELRIAVVTDPDGLAAWDWVKWLPHAGSPRVRDAAGPARLVATRLADLEPLLPEGVSERPRFQRSAASTDGPHLLVVLDGGEVSPSSHVVTADGVQGVTVLDLPAAWADLTNPSVLRLSLEDDSRGDGRVPTRALRVDEEPSRLWADQLSITGAEAVARRLAPRGRQRHTSVAEPATAAGTEYTDLLALPGVHDLGESDLWPARPPRDRLRVPFGLDPAGAPVHLDIKESAQQGMGPHGLVIGAIGSGKSEFLRTLVLGLALTSSPEALNFVLVDFKGGATFVTLADLPHVSAVITNLQQELPLVDRMQDVLSGELDRRQELLRAAGNYASVVDYAKARAAGAPLDPLPNLFVVVDEFTELLTTKPEFIDLFVRIGRLGRSLGVHLLLASQRLEEGRLRGLDSHLSYRIGLRTFTALESRAVLGVPDAHTLPAVPGVGYLRSDPATLTRFTASYVSGPPGRRRSTTRRRATTSAAEVLPFTVEAVSRDRSTATVPASTEPQAPAPAPATGETEPSLMDLAVQVMRDHGRPARRIWLPPLDTPATLDSLLPDLATDPEHGLHSPRLRAGRGLTVPVGTVDLPKEQRREDYVLDLLGARGHVGIVGGPRSGKSTAARTLVAALALAHTPHEVQVYVLDIGGAFAGWERLPHIAGVAARNQVDIVRRVVAEVTGLADAREAYFRRQGIDSIERYRALRAAGEADDGYGDVFLVVDGWGTIKTEFDALDLELQDLAQRSLTFGIHLVTTANRWTDYRAALRDVLGTRIELRLGDPLDSEVDRRVAALVPTERPGRGLTPSRHHCLLALPRIDGEPDGGTVGEGVDHLMTAVTEAWQGPPGPQLRLLPDRIDLDEVRAAVPADDRRLYLGIDERSLAPVGLDVDTDPHLLVFGDRGSGTSALLRTYLKEVMRTRTPDEAQIMVVDYRRALLDEVPEDRLVGYLTNAEHAGREIRAMTDFLRQRIPGPTVTAKQLRERSWWTGKELFLVVDDYDLVVTSQGSPLQPLVDLMPLATDIGLHVVIARRVGGATRAMHEPMIVAMRDLGAPGVILSGSPDEGPLIDRVKAVPAVPGRGRLVTRGQKPDVIQIAWTDPAG